MNNLFALHFGFHWSKKNSAFSNTPFKFNKNHFLSFIKYTTTCFIFIVLFAATSQAQTPQYYNYQGVGASNNIFPFAVAAGKEVQWLFLASDLNQPTPCPAGNITKIYIWMNTAGTSTYTNFLVKMGQSAITTLPAGVIYTGQLDTVYYRASVSLTSTALSWMVITLDRPYNYNPSQSLILDIIQCGSTATTMQVRQNALTGGRRNYINEASCVPAFSGQDASIINFGVDIAPPLLGPDMFHYKIEDSPSPTSLLNCAVPGVGTQVATFSALTLTSGGQFDTCLTGTGLASGGITTGWNCNLAQSSWTISMWLSIPTETDGLAYYLFGDAGSGTFRCFHNGIALPNNLVLRGGFTDVTVTGTGPAPTVVTFVYDSAAGNIKAYKNGALAVTSTQSINIVTGTGFKVGGYTTSPTFKGKMDEFRMYRRALTAAEVLATYNQDIACGLIVGVNNNNTEVPKAYMLNQNYPNPFNPVTTIKFSIPKSGLTKIVVYDILGREVKTLLNTELTRGTYDVTFSSVDIASGTYFYTLTSGDFKDTKKMVILK